jgi:hypothetical protein
MASCTRLVLEVEEMKKNALSVGVIVLSLAGTACNEARDATTVDETGDATMTTGTGGADMAAPAAPQPAEASQPAEAALPATASALPLIGGLGLLAIAGAAGLRMIR